VSDQPRPVVIDVDNVSKRFVIHQDKSVKERLLNFGGGKTHREDFWALRDVSLTIESGQTIGLIGPNGSGKSTLLKAIGGIIQPTRGTVRSRGRLAALLELGAGFHQDLTGRENVYLNASVLGLTKKQTDEHFDAIVEFSGIEQFIDTQVKFYSSGMYVRLAFSVAVHVDPDILLVDEVLAVGDEPFQQKCMDKIREFQKEGRTIIIVSHGLSQITDLCNRALVLSHGHVAFDGDPVDAVAVLRAGFDAEGRVRSRRDETDGNSGASLVDISLPAKSSDDVEETHRIESGDPLRIRVKADSATPVPEWSVGVSIDSAFGQLITATTSSSLSGPLGQLDGETTVEFRLDDLHLGAGDYFVSAALYNGEGKEIDRIAQGVRFQVAADRRSIGPLYVMGEASLVE